jgi:hypothetical protein
MYQSNTLLFCHIFPALHGVVHCVTERISLIEQFTMQQFVRVSTLARIKQQIFLARIPADVSRYIGSNLEKTEHTIYEPIRGLQLEKSKQ